MRIQFLIIGIGLVFGLFACTTVKVAVPQQFSSQATAMKVKGLQGMMINQKISFGEYASSNVKRGWDFSSSMQASRISFRWQDQLVKIFNIQTDNKTLNESNKFQFTLGDGKQETAVFAMEKFNEKQLVYKSGLPVIGDVAQTKNYQYSFSAAIMLLSGQVREPWQLVLVNRYDAKADTAKGLFDRPYVEEHGYASNGDVTFTIHPLRISSYENPKGKDVKVLGGPMFTGYELKVDNGVVAVVDIIGEQVWLLNDMDPTYRIVAASVASALMLKRKQDINSLNEQRD
ncbi:hypothetical protein KJS94_00715 [Flavihumibacter rivuli]|uniref:hypothetical protein n=1 Tax=Flavihumibacter rivuli TaxID=2838156 RepID=UPI001BDEEAAB|nr:hypothetical protein [Flavihumibacter rivuli]ULQ56715.1 hypothetical protein KJS94_00715 [Flavihumibacter rivuli]